MLEAAYGLVDVAAVADAAGDLHDGIGVHQLVGIDLLEDTHNHVGMAIIHGIDERLAGGGILGVDIPGDLAQHLAVEMLVDDGLVEIVHVEVEFVFQQGAVGDLAALRIVDGHRIAGLVVNALLAEPCAQLVRSVMIRQKAVDDCLPVGIAEDRRAENPRGLQGRCGRQPDLDRLKVVDDFSVFALIVALIAVELFLVAHFPVKDVAPVGLVHDNQIIVADGGHPVAALAVEDAFDHTLYRGDVDARFPFSKPVRQAADSVDLAQGVQLLEPDIPEHLQRLRAEGMAIHEKEHAPETPALEKAIHQAQHGAGFARARGHGQQHALRALPHGPLGGLDGAQLVVPQVEAVGVGQEVAGQGGKAAVARFRVALKQLLQTGGTHPAVQGLRRMGGRAHVLKPDARAFLMLAKVGAAIGRKEKGHAKAAPLAHDVGQVLRADVAGVVLALMIEDGGNILVGGLGLDEAQQARARKKGIVGIAPAARGGIRGPFGNGQIAPGLRPYAAGMAQVFGIGLPAHLPELLINEIARLGFGDAARARRLGCAAATLLPGQGGGLSGARNRLIGKGLVPPGVRGPRGGRTRRLGRHKGLRAVGRVAIGLEEPAAQAVRDLQENARLAFRRRRTLMGGPVAGLAQEVKGGGHIRGQHIAPLQDVDALHGVAAFGQGNAVLREHDPDHAFAEQTRLHQAGWGIGMQIAFGQQAEFGQLREFLVQKGKVGRHARSLRLGDGPRRPGPVRAGRRRTGRASLPPLRRKGKTGFRPRGTAAT